MDFWRFGRAIGFWALGAVVAVFMLVLPAPGFAASSMLEKYLAEFPAADLVDGADGYGPIHADIAAAPILRGAETVGWAFVNSDLVGAIGYSSKPIHILVAIGPDAVILSATLVAQSEPMLQSGRHRGDVTDMVANYAGRDLKPEAEPGGSGVERPYVSGVSVSVRVIEDSIVRAGLKVAFALGLGGLETPPAPDGSFPTVDPKAEAPESWQELLDLGLVRRLSIENDQLNADFAAPGQPPAAARFPVDGPPDAQFIDLYTALISAPGIAKALLRPVHQDSLKDWLEEGDQAILVGARGSYSFRGTKFRENGVYDRIVLIQGEKTIPFNVRDHYGEVFRLTAPGRPILPEISLFKIPAFAGFDPAQPWRLELLVERRMGAASRAFQTYSLSYALPDSFILPPSVTPAMLAAAVAEREAAANVVLRNDIWRGKTVEIAGVALMLAVLTAAFFFQNFIARSARFTYWFRMSYLAVTLVFLGWYANAQLSIINLMALAASLQTGFTWDTFVLDPLTFILWFSVAAALIFWGRGAYCGWLCPFGALQEITNRIARAFHVPQWSLPWGLHERLWPVKYIIFLGLFGATLVSLELAMPFTEVEPFRTAIVMKFSRSWPFLLYVLILLGIGLFVERFYCRYLCPLGAALAIPARIRMFDWLKRYRDCGNPCQICNTECMVQAIHPTGEINPNECLGCLHCQVLYHSKTRCPVVIKKFKRRAAVAGTGPRVAGAPGQRGAIDLRAREVG